MMRVGAQTLTAGEFYALVEANLCGGSPRQRPHIADGADA
jgi:hypothetical protein